MLVLSKLVLSSPHFDSLACGACAVAENIAQSLVSVDGCSIDNTTRDESSKYLDKGFSPAATDTDAALATEVSRTQTAPCIDVEGSGQRPTDGVDKPKTNSAKGRLPSASRPCSSVETPSLFEEKVAKPPTVIASAGETERPRLPKSTSSDGAECDHETAAVSRPDTAMSHGSNSQAVTSHEQAQEPVSEQQVWREALASCVIFVEHTMLEVAPNAGRAHDCDESFPRYGQVFYPSNNKKSPKLALTVRSNGTAVFLWPNGKVAVMIDYVALRGSNKGASGGYSASASHHKSGAFALNFDAAGTGAHWLRVGCGEGASPKKAA